MCMDIFWCCVSEGLVRLVGKRRLTQLTYISLVVFFILPVALLSFIVDKIDNYISITPKYLVLRISLALFVLFFLGLIIMLTRSFFSQVYNENFFCLKYILAILFFVGAIFLPTSVLNAYGALAKVCSVLFLVFQAIILIDIFYLLGIILVSRYHSGQRIFSGGCLIGLTIIFQGVALFLNILAYIRYSHDSCGSTQWVSIVTTILLIALPLIQLLNFNVENSLLTTALVSCLVSYTSFAAQQFFKDGCQIRLDTAGYVFQVLIGLFLFLITTFGTLMGGFSKHEYDQQYQEQHHHQQGDQNNESKRHKIAGIVQKAYLGETLHEYTQNWGWVRWHLYMCLGIMYLSMLFTNWGTTERIGQDLIGNDFVFWLKNIISWWTALVYLWTLIAPGIFPERDFSVQQ